jgi:hypothetical protein
MNERAKHNLPLTDDELDSILASLQAIASNANCPLLLSPSSSSSSSSQDDFTTFLREVAHLSHKDWSVTEQNAQRLQDLLFLPQDNNDTTSGSDLHTNEPVRHMLERIIQQGNWDGAEYHASKERPSENELPWVVLVTGVNGIRKSTSMYMPWFADVLQEALIAPLHTDNKACSTTSSSKETLPTGKNSFFRQLDHMIATICNQEFSQLYQMTANLLVHSSSTGTSTDHQPSPDVVQEYSNLKAAIFTRYRTLSELLGVVLLQHAQRHKMNCLMETSGRDVAMFQYVDHFFSSSKYKKLALRFQINDLEAAKRSVDQRMIREIQLGIQAKQLLEVVYANMGGPYGSSVLEGVQTDSDNVWKTNVLAAAVASGVADGSNVSIRDSWYTATIQIDAHETEPWTACAVLADGTRGTVYSFEENKFSNV